MFSGSPTHSHVGLHVCLSRTPDGGISTGALLIYSGHCWLSEGKGHRNPSAADWSAPLIHQCNIKAATPAGAERGEI